MRPIESASMRWSSSGGAPCAERRSPGRETEIRRSGPPVHARPECSHSLLGYLRQCFRAGSWMDFSCDGNLMRTQRLPAPVHIVNVNLIFVDCPTLVSGGRAVRPENSLYLLIPVVSDRCEV